MRSTCLVMATSRALWRFDAADHTWRGAVSRETVNGHHGRDWFGARRSRRTIRATSRDSWAASRSATGLAPRVFSPGLSLQAFAPAHPRQSMAANEPTGNAGKRSFHVKHVVDWLGDGQQCRGLRPDSICSSVTGSDFTRTKGRVTHSAREQSVFEREPPDTNHHSREHRWASMCEGLSVLDTLALSASSIVYAGSRCLEVADIGAWRGPILVL